MKLLHFFFITCLFALNQITAQTQIGQDISGLYNEERSGKTISMSGDGNTITVGSPDYKINGYFTGLVRTYQFDGTNWLQLGSEIMGPDSSGSARAISLSASGDFLAIGHDQGGQKKGKVRVFNFNGIDWIQIGQIIEDIYPGDMFGTSVDLSDNGDRIAIGVPGDLTTIKKKVNVYEFNGTSWVQLGQSIEESSSNSAFGYAVDLSSNGNTIVIGAPIGSAPEYASVYQYNGTSWTQVGQDITSSGTNYFGNDVKISSSGNIIAIGAPYQNNRGGTSVYEYNGSSWIQLGSTLQGEASFDHFGADISLSASGHILAVGASFNDGNGTSSGHVRMHTFDGFDWIQIGPDFDGSAFTNSGNAVALSSSGRTLGIGVPNNHPLTNNNPYGKAEVFGINGIAGRLFVDLNQNCIPDSIEIGVHGRKVVINPGGYSTTTNEQGEWFINSLPVGTYSVTVDTSSSLWSLSCPSTTTFTINSADTLLVVEPIGLKANYLCSGPDISILMPSIRPCFTDQPIYIKACNTLLATTAINNATVIVTLDNYIQPTYFEIPEINLGNNQYQFNVDTLSPGACVSFKILATVSCQAPLGAPVCLSAMLGPLDSCSLDSLPRPFPPCTTLWDNSSLTVSGYCQNDTVYFEVINIGSSMSCHHPVRIFVDGVLHSNYSVQLNAQQSTVYSFPAMGESWHLQAMQHPLHPGNSNPRATVENCGGTTTPSLINSFAQDDADAHVDTYCGVTTAAFDPNDKTGFPNGQTEDHFILANQQIQYRIRFQNTGTDTAFNVVIRDTLDTNLDLFSLRSGVSSHPYSFRIYGQRILEWTFPNIMLPDSNINEPASHGFILFTVEQSPDLPDGTLITNSAGIYFDFNAPIITNTYMHTITEPLISTATDATLPDKTDEFSCYPNPTNGQFTLDFGAIYDNVDIQITDASGRVIQKETVHHKAQYHGSIKAANGIYFLTLKADTITKTFKLIIL